MIRVMIVEDEPPINRLLQALVSEHKEDFQIVSAVYDGKEALDMKRRFPILQAVRLRPRQPPVHALIYAQIFTARSTFLKYTIHDIILIPEDLLWILFS